MHIINGNIVCEKRSGVFVVMLSTTKIVTSKVGNPLDSEIILRFLSNLGMRETKSSIGSQWQTMFVAFVVGFFGFRSA